MSTLDSGLEYPGHHLSDLPEPVFRIGQRVTIEGTNMHGTIKGKRRKRRGLPEYLVTWDGDSDWSYAYATSLTRLPKGG